MSSYNSTSTNTTQSEDGVPKDIAMESFKLLLMLFGVVMVLCILIKIALCFKDWYTNKSGVRHSINGSVDQ